jgi:SAM-dependent methyltransferase
LLGDTGLYTKTLANLPHTAVCHISQTQAERHAHTPPRLPFRSNTFDVVSSRTLYKFISTIHQAPTQGRSWIHENMLESWLREIHRLLDKRGSFEYIFFERRLNHAGPLARELEPFFYEDQFPFCYHPQSNHSDIITRRENCHLCHITATDEPVTVARFLELLANEGFTIGKNMTIMFPIPLLSTIFTQDGQRFREHGGKSELNEPHVTPILASLMEKVHEECRESQAAWKCIIGCASKT